jgi:predicted TIM-barrel fold metal-dependent hydrolase
MLDMYIFRRPAAIGRSGPASVPKPAQQVQFRQQVCRRQGALLLFWHRDGSRRDFLTGVAATAAAAATASTSEALRLAGARSAQAQAPPIPIIDTHIHLFDPTRPQGAPYSGPPPAPGATPIAAYPDRYRRLAVPLGVVGAIKIEASPWIEDNLWVLEVAERDPIMVGVVGNLEPDKPEFPQYLERYHKNPLFRGIRYGNLWGRDITKQSSNPDFIVGLKRLAEADLVLDTANPRVPLLEAVLRISDAVPALRIVLDHLPALDPTAADRAAYDAALREIGTRPQIFVKLSEIIHRVNGQVSTALSTYRARLDTLMGVFGEDRILFGSDWPNSDGVAPIDKVFAVANEYFLAQPRSVAEKYFWKNSVAAYKWVRRDPSQPTV